MTNKTGRLTHRKHPPTCGLRTVNHTLWKQTLRWFLQGTVVYLNHSNILCVHALVVVSCHCGEIIKIRVKRLLGLLHSGKRTRRLTVSSIYCLPIFQLVSDQFKSDVCEKVDRFSVRNEFCFHQACVLRIKFMTS